MLTPWHHLIVPLNFCRHVPGHGKQYQMLLFPHQYMAKPTSIQATCLNKLLALSTIVFGRLIRSAIVDISLKAAIKARSELLIVRLF